MQRPQTPITLGGALDEPGSTWPSQRWKTPIGTSQPTSKLLQAHLLGSFGLENLWNDKLFQALIQVLEESGE